MIRILALLIAGATSVACAHQITGPHTDLSGLPSGLDVQFTVAPGEVRPHEAFSAELTVTNTTAEVIKVVTANGCLAVPHVIRDGQRVPFRGSNVGCYAAVKTHTFAPGETRTHVWDMRAELYAEQPGEVEDAPAPAGTYVVQAEFDTYSEHAPNRKPVVERALQVR